MEDIALGPMNRKIEQTEKTLEALFTCQEKYQKPKNRSTLMLVIDYWVFDNRGKELVRARISEITDHIKAIKMIVAEVHMCVCTSNN